MATSYSARYSRPLGVGSSGFGGAGLNLGIEALAGETEMITTFEDFNQSIIQKNLATTTVANTITSYGFVVTEVGGVAPAASLVYINDPQNSRQFASSLSVMCGTDVSEGGNIQFDFDGAAPNAAHINLMPLPITTTDRVDNTVVVFACRVGIVTDNAAGTFNGGLYIGFAEEGDVGIMTAATGVITVASTGSLQGFHINGNVAATPNISLVSKRETADAMVEGTTFTALRSGVGSFETGLDLHATDISFTTARWFDLAFRAVYTDNSDDTNNGSVQAFMREVPAVSEGSTAVGTFQGGGHPPGLNEFNQVGNYAGWQQMGATLINENPQETGEMVFTVEAINGIADQSGFHIDWVAMGQSRWSRKGEI